MRHYKRKRTGDVQYSDATVQYHRYMVGMKWNDLYEIP